MTTPLVNSGTPQTTAQEVAGVNGLQDAVNWDDVHRLVQGSLAKLVVDVCRDRPDIRPETGRTEARSYYLYSYCDFDIPSDRGIEAVGAAVDFKKGPGNNETTVVGEIVREGTGDILFEFGERILPLSQSVILATAAEFSKILAEQADLIVDGLSQPCDPACED